VPGHKYTFGVVKAAQARGDFQVLAERRRRALRVHLGADVRSGLDKLLNAVTQAIDEGAPAPVLSAALYQRFSSRGEEDFANTVLSAMRYEFGGHVQRPAGG
jgi:hypothetical protein